ncbi:MAG: hypothetical protein ABIB71_00005, partial [Candidatus Woesearchaeota archaeon]
MKKPLIFLLVLFPLLVGSAYANCQGCIEDGGCYPFGTTLTIDNKRHYCDIMGEFMLQNPISEPCDNNYECFSGFCSYGKCDDLYQRVVESRDVAERISGFLGATLLIDEVFDNSSELHESWSDASWCNSFSIGQVSVKQPKGIEAKSRPNALHISGFEPPYKCKYDACYGQAEKVGHDPHGIQKYSFDLVDVDLMGESHFTISDNALGSIKIKHCAKYGTCPEEYYVSNGSEMLKLGKWKEYDWKHFDVTINWETGSYELKEGANTVVGKLSEETEGEKIILKKMKCGSLLLDNLKVETLYEKGCGNIFCDIGEDCSNCPGDCGCETSDVCGDDVCSASEGCGTCEADCACKEGFTCRRNICKADRNVLIDEVKSTGATEKPPKGWEDSSSNCEPFRNWHADYIEYYDSNRGGLTKCELTRGDHLSLDSQTVVVNEFSIKPAYFENIWISAGAFGDYWEIRIKKILDPITGKERKVVEYLDGMNGQYYPLDCEISKVMSDHTFKIRANYLAHTYDFEFSNTYDSCNEKELNIPLRKNSDVNTLSIRSEDSTTFSTQLRLKKAYVYYERASDADMSKICTPPCTEDEGCMNNTCKKLECGNCEYIKYHRCVKYDCCSNEDCKDFSTCNLKTHTCRDCADEYCCPEGEMWCEYSEECTLPENCLPEVKTDCKGGWPLHDGPKIVINENNYACDLFEVTRDDFDYINEEATTCCQSSCSDSKCHGFCGTAYSQSGLAFGISSDKLQKCAALYTIYGLGPAAKWMKGYYREEIECMRNIRKGIMTSCESYYSPNTKYL